MQHADTLTRAASLIRGSHVRYAVPIGLHLIRRNRVQKTGIRFRADIRRRNTVYAQRCSLFFRGRRTTSVPVVSRIHFGSDNSNRDIGVHCQAYHERSFLSPSAKALQTIIALRFPSKPVVGIIKLYEMEIAARQQTEDLISQRCHNHPKELKHANTDPKSGRCTRCANDL